MIGLDRLKRAISDVPTGGMQTGSPKVKLDLSFAHRIVAEMEHLEREKAELLAQVANQNEFIESVMANIGARATIDEVAGMLCDWWDNKPTPTQCLNQIKAEAGRTGFVAGADALESIQILGSMESIDELAEEYAASIAHEEWGNLAKAHREREIACLKRQAEMFGYELKEKV